MREYRQQRYDRLTNCEYAGVPRWLMEPYVKEFVNTPEQSWFLNDFMDETRRIETTIHDPDALTTRWTLSRDYQRRAEWTIAEYIYQRNNRNFTTDDGNAGIDLEHEVSE